MLFVQTIREHNKKLAEDLELAQAQLKSVKAELEDVKSFTREAHGKSRTVMLFLIKLDESIFC